MNRIILQHTRGTTKEDFIQNKYISWAEQEKYENIWKDSIGDIVLLVEGGMIFAITTIENIEYDYESFPKYPLRYYWNNNIQFVNIPLADFNEIVGHDRNYTRIKYHPIKKEFLEQGLDFLSKYIQKPYDENEDAQYQEDIQKIKHVEIKEDKPIIKKSVRKKQNENCYPRSPYIAKTALQQANFKCELDENHTTFISRFSEQNFTEAHHLIPILFHEEFNYDLDVPANIVSLCPNCHRLIHYGCQDDILNALAVLYKKRKERLKKVQLTITLDELQYLYNLDNKSLDDE